MTDTITLPKEALGNLTEALENLMAWQVKNCKVWDHPTWDNAHMRLEQVRAALAQQAEQVLETRTLWECRSCGHLYDEKVSSCDCLENGANEYNEWVAEPKGGV